MILFKLHLLNCAILVELEIWVSWIDGEGSGQAQTSLDYWSVLRMIREAGKIEDTFLFICVFPW